MPTVKQFTQIKTFFNAQRKFYDNHFYRLVTLDEAEDEYEIEIATPGFCGDFIPAPKIKFHIDDNKLIPTFLINQEATPIVTIVNHSSEDEARLSEALDEVFNQFLAKIDN
ncbi:MAG: hypothetical protein LBS33_07580 [Streptococcaceae bacterium]|jgi:hypothetical protein|nr:hypothetical protein [Streptococcaceae bacterium]